jgi:hypothetical protein
MKKMKLESLKKYQIEPVERMSCIRGGGSTPTTITSTTLETLAYSSDAVITTTTNGKTTSTTEYYGYCSPEDPCRPQKIQALDTANVTYPNK